MPAKLQSSTACPFIPLGLCVVQMLNNGNGVQPLKVDTHALLDAAQQLLSTSATSADSRPPSAPSKSLLPAATIC